MRFSDNKHALSKLVLLFFLAVLISLYPPLPAFAKITDEQLEKYSSNNIYFYDPSDDDCDYASQTGNDDGDDVYMIGDSITYISQSKIKEKIPNITINAQSNIYFSHNEEGLVSGVDRIKEMGDQKILVFALGTNGGINMGDHEDDTEKLMSAVEGKNIKIIVMTIYYRDNAVDQMNTSNDNIRAFADQHENVSIMDWNAVASADPTIMEDNAHPNADTGYDKFAETVRDAVNAVSEVGVEANAGDGDYSNIMTAKNANEYVFNVPNQSEWSAWWSDTDTASMKKLLENYGDLAYQLGRAVGAPYIAILVQMRYEDANSVCGANNFWGNGCPPGTGAGGATKQGKNLGDGFVKYGETLTNGMHDQALGESDPEQYLRKIGPTWVQGNVNGPGYAAIENMAKSVDVLTEYVNSSEGQAIVSQFGHYTGTYEGGVECPDPTAGVGNGVTTLEIDGATYAFPIAYATKENYLNNTAEHPSALSTKSSGWYHHEYPAVDLGIYYKMVTGKEFSPSDYPQWQVSSYDSCGLGVEHCNSSTGAPVVSMTDGVIDYYRYYSRAKEQDQQYCASTRVKTSVGNHDVYLYIHLGYEDEYAAKVGQQVKAGDVIGHVGTQACAEYTQAHVHVQDGEKSSDIKTLIDKLYDALPEDAAELAAREQSSGAVSGGLTEEQAQKIATRYKKNTDQGEWIVPSNGAGMWNCVSFSAYFVQRFTSIGKVDRVWGNGKEVAESLANTYNLPTSTEPKPFSVFSVTKGTIVCDDGYLCGHTGIVVAVNGNDVTTIEAAYGNEGYTEVVHRDISYFVNDKYTNTFTYLDSIMDMDALNEVIK